MFNSILNTVGTSITPVQIFMCTGASLVLGLVLAFVHSKTTTKNSKNFVTTLIILPVLIQVVIMLVNGNLGTSVAIVGAFSLVRFRSIPGNSKEITSIFLAMLIGLATGMGYLTLALFVTVVVSILLFWLSRTSFFEKKSRERFLKILIPEDLNYVSVFDDLLKKYAVVFSVAKVKTSNMGSLYEITYRVVLKDDGKEKDFIDDLRVKNGNLKIVLEDIDEMMEL